MAPWNGYRNGYPTDNARKPRGIMTCLLKKDKKYLYTFASYSKDGFYGDRNVIPLGVVKNISKINH